MAPEPWDYHDHVETELKGGALSPEELADVHRRLQLIVDSLHPSPPIGRSDQDPMDEDGECLHLPYNLLPRADFTTLARWLQKT